MTKYLISELTSAAADSSVYVYACVGVWLKKVSKITFLALNEMESLILLQLQSV